MADNAQLEAMLDRMVEAQHALIFTAAEAAVIPSDKSLRKIADLESAIRAVEDLLEHREGRPA